MAKQRSSVIAQGLILAPLAGQATHLAAEQDQQSRDSENPARESSGLNHLQRNKGLVLPALLSVE
jgi:hypothetical protein